jgi:hypothetical protein
MAMLVVAMAILVADFLNIGRILHVGALAWQRAGALWNGEQQSGGNTNRGERFIHYVFLSWFRRSGATHLLAMGSRKAIQFKGNWAGPSGRSL